MFRKIMLLATVVLTANLVNAQMEAAQKIKLDIDTGIAFKSSTVPALWDAIKDPAKWADISNGYVQSIETAGSVENLQRTFVFADGTQRKDQITQYQPEYKMIVFKVKEPLEPSIKECSIFFVIRSNDSGVPEFHVGAIIHGSNSDKEKMLPRLKKELGNYLQGMSSRFSQ